MICRPYVDIGGTYLYIPVRPSSPTEPVKPALFRYLRTRRCDDPALFPGCWLIDSSGVSPGSDPSIYAYVKTTMHRNLFRIPLHTE